jgi:serine/threonine protein kinase
MNVFLGSSEQKSIVPSPLTKPCYIIKVSDKYTMTDSSRNKVGAAALIEKELVESRSRLRRNPGVAQVAWEDIKNESLLGVGCYCRVYKVRVQSPDHALKNDDNQKAEYALKCLSPSTMERPKHFLTGALDLVTEADVLSRLDHKNIIKLHGVSSGCVAKLYEETEGYFLLLDVVHDTLKNRLKDWREIESRPKSLVLRGQSIAFGNSKYAMTSRIENVAIDVALAMEYAHSKNVVIRDLKPDNIGFAEDGTLKLLDFGFAREVHTLNSNEVAGSLRYMAPETGLQQGTCLASDVYSFGILLWELCTLKKPFDHFKSPDELKRRVFREHYRPSVSSIPSPALRRLITECWDFRPEKRPDFSRIVKTLKLEVLRGERKSLGNSTRSLYSVESPDSNRRSTSFKGLVKSFSGSFKRSFRMSLSRITVETTPCDESGELNNHGYSKSELSVGSLNSLCQCE